jgi:predicted nuclease of predicted toxin-antitoxin system
MRILANETFPGEAVDALRDRGHDVAWVRTDTPGSTDIEVLARAQAEGRLLVTLDKDFGELAARDDRQDVG